MLSRAKNIVTNHTDEPIVPAEYYNVFCCTLPADNASQLPRQNVSQCSSIDSHNGPTFRSAGLRSHIVHEKYRRPH